MYRSNIASPSHGPVFHAIQYRIAAGRLAGRHSRLGLCARMLWHVGGVHGHRFHSDPCVRQHRCCRSSRLRSTRARRRPFELVACRHPVELLSSGGSSPSTPNRQIPWQKEAGTEQKCSTKTAAAAKGEQTCLHMHCISGTAQIRGKLKM